MDRYLSVALRQIEAINGGIIHAIEFVQRVDERLAAIEAATAAINEKGSSIMALTQQESDAFAKLGSDLDGWKSGLQSQLDALTTSAASLQAGETADQATITQLNATIAGLQTTVDNTPDVVAAVNALDAKVAPADGTTTTTTTPAPAPVDPNAPPAAAPAPAAQTGQLADLTGHGSTDAPAPDAGVGATTPPDTTATTPAGTDPAAAL